MAKWTKTDIEGLIDAYEAESCLYVVKHPDYYNKHLRNDAMARILERINLLRPGTNHAEMTRKIHALRTSFSAESKKVKDSMKSGAGTSQIYKPTLWYFDRMRFLEEHVTPRKSVTVGCKARLPKTEPVVSKDNAVYHSNASTSAASTSITAHQPEAVDEEFSSIEFDDSSVIVDDHDYLHSSQLLSSSSADVICEVITGNELDNETCEVDNDTCEVDSVSNHSFAVPKRVRGSSESSSTSSTASSSKKRHRFAKGDSDDKGLEKIINSLMSPIMVPVVKATEQLSKVGDSGPVDSLMATVAGILKRIPNEADQERIMCEVLTFVVKKKSELNS